MRTWREIDLNDVHEDDILDRDKAIVELWDAFRAYMKVIVPFTSDKYLTHPVLNKYRDFVEKSRT